MTRHPHARGPGAAHEQQRRNIIEAVFTVVDEAGTGQATVRNVAKAAGVSPGRVQHYFKTKDALLEAAFTAVTEAGTENIRRRLAESGSDGEEAIVATTLTELIPVDEDHRRLVRVSQAFEVYAMSRPELRERLHDDYDRLIALIAGLLPTDSSAPAAELIALANGLGWMAVTGNADPGEAREAVEARVREAFAAGGRAAPFRPRPA